MQVSPLAEGRLCAAKRRGPSSGATSAAGASRLWQRLLFGVQLNRSFTSTRAQGVRHLERHLARLAAGAAWLGFPCDVDVLRVRLAEACAAFADADVNAPHRLRLAHDTVGVLLAPDRGFAPVASADALLLRKSTRRAEFDRAWREAEALGGFDMLFFNERGGD